MKQRRRSIAGPAAWYGRDIAGSSDWVYRFTADDVGEIDGAVQQVRENGVAMVDVGREDFPLPRLGAMLDAMRNQVVHGRGFVLFRGLPVDRYGIEEAALAYWGIGCYFGWAVSQNADGHLLGHVTDIGRDPSDPNNRIYQTSARHLYHTDSCDVVGLMCLRPAKRGGLSSIASSVTIYNEMVRVRPDLVETLMQPFHVDRKGEVPAGKRPYYEMPVFNDYAGCLTTIYARDFIEAAQRFPEVPRLSEAQIAAMDLFDTLAGRDEIRLDMTLAAGDMQFLHNHQIVHARTAYEDHPEPERKRHLLRLWLSPPDGRPLPPVFAERYGTIDTGRPRGGIVVPGTKLQAPLVPA